MKKYKYRIIFISVFVALIVTACSQNNATPITEPAQTATIAVERNDQTGDESIDASTDDTALQPAPGEASLTWRTEEIGTGIKPAFAIDDEGVIHVAFLTEEDHGGVFFANNASGLFESETVAEGYFYGPVDIAVSADGVPYIAYHDHQDLAFKPALGDEVVAVPQGGVWELTTVADEGHDGWDNAIVLDDQSNWHTASIDPAQFGSQSDVEYATNAGGSVQVSQVGSGPIDYEFGTSIALDPEGVPGITYYNNGEKRLEIAVLGPEGWSVEVVDENGDAGRYSALTYDADGNPHISYFAARNRESGTVRYAHWDGSQWQIEDVDTLDNIRMGSVGARKITSLVIDTQNNPHLAYTDRDRMVYATKGADGWTMQEVVTAGERPLGQLVELALDGDGNPQLIWFQPTSFSPVLSGKVMYTTGS
jgi:hypothetical protein